jgi:hypothetical protein
MSSLRFMGNLPSLEKTAVHSQGKELTMFDYCATCGRRIYVIAYSETPPEKIYCQKCRKEKEAVLEQGTGPDEPQVVQK